MVTTDRARRQAECQSARQGAHIDNQPRAGTSQAGETIRQAVASVTGPAVERHITASLGIAGLFEYAGNATGLVREADAPNRAANAAAAEG